jgi:photosystem II stability/assembly factor-like uncharacterized protein
MRADELRRELSEMADEPPVTVEDVRTVMQRGHRRIVRRYLGISAVALIVVIGLVSFGARGQSPSEHVEVRPTVPTTVAPTRPRPQAQSVASSGTGVIIFTSANVGWICGDPMLHTGDGGRTWQASSFGESRAGQATACASVPGDDLWAVVGTTHPSVLAVQGGSSLTTEAPLPAQPDASAVQITFADAQHGWVLARATAVAGTSGLLYRSTNSGLTYTRVSASAPSSGVAFSSATEGWGISEGADLLHTTDAGSTWNEVRVPFPTPGPREGIVFETISVAGPLIVAQGRRNEGHRSSEFFDVSHDDGRTWTLRYGPTAPLGASPPVAIVDAEHWRLLANPSVWITDDAGATWTQRPAPVGAAAAIAFPTPDEGWALADGRVFETTDGATSWHPVETTPQPDWHTGLASVPDECPTRPVTPAPSGSGRQAAAIRAARAFVLRTRGWTTERVDAAYKVGQVRGVYSSIFAYNVPKYCGQSVAATSYGVELANDSITENNSRETALVVAHFADGWRVWGDYR